MYWRTEKKFNDLTSFISALEARRDFVTIKAPVSPYLEITEIHRKVIEQGGPALRFDTVTLRSGQKSNMPLVTNIFGTRERVALGLGCKAGRASAIGRIAGLFAFSAAS